MESEEYEDELVTSHSDENPELNRNRTNSTGTPLATYVNDGAPSDALAQRQRERERTRGPFGYVPKDGEQVIDEDIFIPASDD